MLITVLFAFSFMAACSKNLMPPEGLDTTASVSSQMSQSSDSRGGAGGGAGPGFNITEQESGSGSGFLPDSGFNITEQGSGSGSGFLPDSGFNITEENVGESARSGDFVTSGPNGTGSGSALGGGSAGRFPSEPFLGNDSGSGGNDSGSGGSGFGSGMDEARTLPFKDTSSLQDIHFKFDRYDLDEDSRSTLRKNASYLKADSSAVIEIQGHCDERGTNNYNVALGERRAHSTKMYLVSDSYHQLRRRKTILF